MQLFLMFFYILDQCYELCEEDDLGRLLGIVSPELWQDGRPIDESLLEKWKQRNAMHEVNDKNIISLTSSFLCYYEQRYGYDFSSTKFVLSKVNEFQIIKDAKDKMQEMYQKYQYID